MSKIKLTGSNSGYVEISSAADAGNLTLALPTSGTVLLSNADNVFTGITTFTGLNITDDVTLNGGSYDVVWDASDNQLEFGDNAKLSFGASSDLQLYHNGSDSFVAETGTGQLKISGSAGVHIMKHDHVEVMASFYHDSDVQLFFNNNLKFKTTNTGAIVTGICTATSFSGSGAGLTGLVTPLSFRNLIINGDMIVAQRGGVTGVTNGFGGPDRFRFQSNYSAVTMSQSTDVPTGQGFIKSLKLDVTTAGGDSNADTYTQIDYRFEGQELARLKYGTSSAETTTLSFWIKSPKTGIHWVRLYGDELNNNAFISRKYTVSSANTWQKVTLNYPNYTTDGFDNDNTTGMRISWYFAQGSTYSSGTAQADDGGWLNWQSASDRARNTVGQVNCFDSTSNDIYLTGVQFEVGSVATPFEHRSLADELTRCQRYYEIISPTGGLACWSWGGNVGSTNVFWKVRKRSTPSCGYNGTLSNPAGSDGTIGVYSHNNGWNAWGTLAMQEPTLDSVRITFGSMGNSWSGGDSIGIYFYGQGSNIYGDSEL